MLKRIIPPRAYENVPCSILAADIALDRWITCCDVEIDDKKLQIPENIKVREDGYVTLNDMNKIIRRNFMVEKRITYKRGERPLLKEYIPNNNYGARILCCLGHYIYQEYDTYYSFFDNANDEVVSVWILR